MPGRHSTCLRAAQERRCTLRGTAPAQRKAQGDHRPAHRLRAESLVQRYDAPFEEAESVRCELRATSRVWLAGPSVTQSSGRARLRSTPASACFRRVCRRAPSRGSGRAKAGGASTSQRMVCSTYLQASACTSRPWRRALRWMTHSHGTRPTASSCEWGTRGWCAP